MAIAVRPVGEHMIASAERSQRSQLWMRFCRHKLGLAGLITITLLVVSVIVVPMLSPFEYDQIDREALVPDAASPNYQFKPALWTAPNSGLIHILGTDAVGRDNFTRLFYGGRISLAVGLITTMLVVLIGAAVGSVAGAFGGWVDTLLMRFVDLMLSLPVLPVLLVLSKLLDQSGVITNVFGRSNGAVITIILVLALFGWLGLSRLVRGSVLTLRSLDYIEAAKALGASKRRIILRHLLPNSIAPIVVAATLAVGEFIVTESFLSFLGLGIQEPTPSWGNLLQGAQEYSSFITDLNPTKEIRGYLILFPGFMILLSVLSINFIGDALRDVLDPRAKT